jgi:hypothetical protein
MPDGTASGRVVEDRFFDRIPPHILASFTAEQRNAIAMAAGEQPRRDHTVNIRMSVPLLVGRYYLTIMGGRERRNALRRRSERSHNPLRTVGNMMFVMLCAVGFYLAAVGLFSAL